MLREELQHLQEQCSYVGEVVKPMDKKKVLVKVHPEGEMFFLSVTYGTRYDNDIFSVRYVPMCCSSGTNVLLALRKSN